MEDSLLNRDGKGKTVTLSTQNGVATALLHNPPLNIMTLEMMQELTEALKRTDQDATPRVLLLRGEGKCFSAGADVREHLPEHTEVLIRTLHELFSALRSLRIPSVAALHGAALGGGFELGTLCDITMASSNCKLGVPEIRLGVFPPLAAAAYPQEIGYKRSLEFLVSGREIAPAEARECGLVNLVYPEENFSNQVEAYVNSLAALSRPAMVLCKKAVRTGTDQPCPKSLQDIESIYLRETMATEDAREGLAAFLEKRKPVWKHI